MVSPSMTDATPAMSCWAEAGPTAENAKSNAKTSARHCVVLALKPLVAGSHLPREPSNPSDDVHLFTAAFLRLVQRIVGDDADPGRIAVGDVLEPLGDETYAIVKHEYAGWRRRAPAEIDQHDVTIVQCRHDAVASTCMMRKLAGSDRRPCFIHER